MTREQIDAVLDRVRSWPASRQERAALMLLALEAEDTSPYVLSSEEQEDLRAALEEVARGEVASDEDVSAVFARHRR
jgi:hypothetical protein